VPQEGGSIGGSWVGVMGLGVQNYDFKKGAAMNPLTSVLLLANPLVTAILTLVIFLESKKQKAQLESIERSIAENSKQVIEAVEKQKDGFDAIAVSLKAISEDQERSVETFTGISNALTTSSTTNQQSLNNVVSALNAASAKTDETMTSLMQGINTSNNDLKTNMKTAYNEATSAIRDVATTVEQEYGKLSDVIRQCEKATKETIERSIETQKELHQGLTESIRLDAQMLKGGIDSNSKELSTINNTLKNAVSI
jgi:hypothetical protein